MLSSETLFTVTKIQYVIIFKNVPDSYPASNLFFEQAILAHLRYYPIDLMQFSDGFDYFAYVKERDSGGIQVLFMQIDQVLKPCYFEMSLKVLEKIGRMVVFMFSLDCRQRIAEAITLISRSRLKHWYFNIYTTEGHVNVTGHTRYFSQVDGLFKLMRRDAATLSKYVSSKIKRLKNLQLKIPANSYQETELVHFRPTVNNTLNILRADNYPYLKSHYNWQRAGLEERPQLLLDSLKELDEIHIVWGEERQLSSMQALATLILVFPFHNPLFRELISHDPKNIFSKMLLAEQNNQYIHEITLEPDDDQEEFKQASEKLITLQTDLLDGISYLHASFEFSPVLRFPVQSSKINGELSMLSLGRAKGIRRSPNRHKLLLRLGKKMTEVYLDAGLEEYLSQRNGQILTVSDLPIEWMLVKGVPLAFVCDVCRIQDSNIQGYLLAYSMASKIRLHLNEKTVGKTLVIFSEAAKDRTDFERSFQLAQKYQDQFKFKIAHAGSARQVRLLLELHQPDILIFDCHGDYEKDSHRCFLWLGDHKVYGEDIIKHEIAAPIVYLCCCNTNPNYDSLEKLHDAFVQAGAVTVTDTFLPLDMARGTFVYLRMLSLLSSRQERMASGNWLHFVSFCMRTSLIWEAQRKAWIKLGRELTTEENGLFIKILEKLHRFEDRAAVFQEFKTKGLRLSEELTLRIEDTNMEFMYYTHYGRPDLIRFTG